MTIETPLCNFQFRIDNCEKHGEFESKGIKNPFEPTKMAFWLKCPVCTKEQSDADAKKEEERKARMREHDKQRAIAASMIPIRYIDSTLSKYQATSQGQAKALAFCNDYTEKFDEYAKKGKSALFVGKPGTGKTHLAIGIALELIDKNHSVLFTTVLRLIRQIKKTWSDHDLSEDDVISEFTRPSLLIIDEIGVQFGSEFEKNMLFDIINERYENRKPVILMSNLPIEEVKNYLGDRVMDRLREDGGKLIVFDWESARGKIQSTSGN
jgi:DNA replication protein DnaC